MKKLIVMIMLVFAGASTTMNAQMGLELKDYNFFYKMSNQSTFSSLVRYLEINSEQAEQLRYVNSLTERKLNNANRRESTVAAERAMLFNLGNAKFILSPDQYRKYLIVLNVSRFSNHEEFLADNK